MSEAKKSKWEQVWDITESCGGNEFIVGYKVVAAVAKEGLEIRGTVCTPEEALAFAAWITAWFGTEVKP